MGPCIACGAPGAHPIRALEVRTLHVRGLGGDRRVQALGEFVDSAVCADCAAKTLALERQPLLAGKKRLLGFGTVFLAGLLIESLTFTLLHGERVYVLLGIAALICGVLGIVSTLRAAKERSAELAAMEEPAALESAAWDVFTAHASKKDGENDLTYIPVNAASLRRKNGDLMVLYQLLPEIANEAYARIHEDR